MLKARQVSRPGGRWTDGDLETLVSEDEGGVGGRKLGGGHPAQRDADQREMAGGRDGKECNRGKQGKWQKSAIHSSSTRGAHDRRRKTAQYPSSIHVLPCTTTAVALQSPPCPAHRGSTRASARRPSSCPRVSSAVRWRALVESLGTDAVVRGVSSYFTQASLS